MGKFGRRLIEAAREAQVIARRGRSIHSDLKKFDAYVITGDEYEEMPRHFLGWVIGGMLRKTLRGHGPERGKKEDPAGPSFKAELDRLNLAKTVAIDIGSRSRRTARPEITTGRMNMIKSAG